MLRYRADIEGLRATAIVPIVLFHAGVQVLRGGYTGVDVFFVISGFLITQILTKDIAAGQFSLGTFYQRRVARILPALFVVLAFVLAVAPVVLVLPGEIADAYRSVAAAAGFVSNIHFLLSTNYFARAAETQVLLHTWSLGVEEQFYIFFPLVLYGLNRLAPRRVVPALALLAVASLAGGLAIHSDYPTRDFYLLPFRAWELLLGGLVGLGAFPKVGPRTGSLLALGGAGLSLAGMLALPNWAPFPSPLALVPAGGTALMIAYGETTLVGKVLATAPMRWIGRISYSLYLWHWPLIVFWRQMTGDDLSAVETAGLVLASVLAASASYWLVEQPLQRTLRAMPMRRSLAIGLGGVVVFVAAGLGLANAAGRIWPVPAEAARLAAYENYNEMGHDTAWTQSAACFVENPSQRFDAARCLALQPGARNVVLLGDSHAHMYGPGLRRHYPGIHWLEATRFGCPPLPKGSYDRDCTGMVKQVLGPLVASGRIERVVLVSRWRQNQAAPLTETVRTLVQQGIPVTVIGPVPEYQGNFPVLLARSIARGQGGEIDRFQVADRAATDRLIGAAAQAGGAAYVSAYATLCPGGRCRLLATDGTPLRFDYGHLTDPGADLVVTAMPAP